MQSSAVDLTKLMKDIDDNADVITALALFPLKSVDKKVCFVLGLALLFKVDLI